MRFYTFKFRRGTSTEWATSNPKLAAGEIGFEINTKQFKIGDGVNLWNGLDYYIPTDAINALIADAIEDLVIEGTPGPPGDSAYEIAVEQGFEGTVEEWLESLVGPKGDDGDPGEPGAKGDDGDPGEPGEDGEDAFSGILPAPSGFVTICPEGFVGSNLTLPSGAEIACPHPVAEDGVITAFAFEVVTAGSTNAVVRGGIRSGNNNKRPGNGSLLVDAGTLATDGANTGVREFVLGTPLAVSKGDVVWFTITAQVAGSTVVRSIGSTSRYTYDSAHTTGTQNPNALIMSGQTGALQANYTPTSITRGPRVSVKWQ